MINIKILWSNQFYKKAKIHNMISNLWFFIIAGGKKTNKKNKRTNKKKKHTKDQSHCRVYAGVIFFVILWLAKLLSQRKDAQRKHGFWPWKCYCSMMIAVSSDKKTKKQVNGWNYGCRKGKLKNSLSLVKAVSIISLFL